MIFDKLKIARSHGQQAIPDLTAVELNEAFRGRPELTAPTNAAQSEAIARAAKICPTQALCVEPLTLDLGRCYFCGECARIAPNNIRFTNDYRMATTSREALVVKVGDTRIEFGHEAVRAIIKPTFGQAIQLREVSAGGDNSVEMELNASGNVNFDLGRFGIGFTASPRHADGVVVSGPITSNMAEALEICYEAVAEPKILVMCGTEACSGGLFDKSRAIDRSILERHTPDMWVPGAPTHPMSYIEGMMNLLGRTKRK